MPQRWRWQYWGRWRTGKRTPLRWRRDYYVQTVTGGPLEEKYTAMGDYEVAYAEYPAADLLSVGPV